MADKPLLFIDTNIFLGFYRADSEALKLLERIQDVPRSLIFTDQVYAEFLKNRQSVISDTLKKMVAPPVPGFLRDSHAFRQLEGAMDTLKKRVSALLESPAKDDHVLEIVEFAKDQGENTDDTLNLFYANPSLRNEIFKAANERFQRGFPPRKHDDTSIGDAINWEWILSCAERRTPHPKIILVSRDADYGICSEGILNDYLAFEMRSREVSVFLTSTLSKALKELGIKVPVKEKEAERKMFSGLSFWDNIGDDPELMARLSAQFKQLKTELAPPFTIVSDLAKT